MYASIQDLPFVCRLNLPEEAQKTYRDAFNRAWRTAADFQSAQRTAWAEVRKEFQRDQESGKWVRASSAVPSPRSAGRGLG